MLRIAEDAEDYLITLAEDIIIVRHVWRNLKRSSLMLRNT